MSPLARRAGAYRVTDGAAAQPPLLRRASSRKLARHFHSTLEVHAAHAALDPQAQTIGESVTLYRGDCFDALPRIPDASIDLILCDLPYGITECSWDTRLPLPKLWEQYLRLIKPNGAIVLTASGSFAKLLQASAPAGLYRYEWIWDKTSCTGFANAHRMPMPRHENVLVFYRRLPTYNPQGLRPVERSRRCAHHRSSRSSVYGAIKGGAYRQRFTGYPNSILSIPRGSGLAACEKPVALMEYFILTYTQPGELVLDNCMGLGAAGVAAAKNNRRFIGIELDRARFAIGRTRIMQATRSSK